jgi:hypothetical protein
MDKGEVIKAHYSAADPASCLLDHAEWANAQPVQVKRYWSGDEAPASRHAEARIIWTEESLAVRFVCNQTEPLIISPNPQLDQKTIGLWDRDVCELFLAPDPENINRYFEFEAAPTGEWIDLAINLMPSGRKTDFNFRSGMIASARIAADQLVISMRVPWSDCIPQPQLGDRWRCNLFRCIGLGNERYLAWQPTYTVEPNFHTPEAFGWLSFG